MISLFTGILIGIGICYLGSLIYDIVKFYNFKTWMISRNIDINSLDEENMRAAMTAYNLRKVPNVIVELIPDLDSVDDKEVE
jgi:hypothetical protein